MSKRGVVSIVYGFLAYLLGLKIGSMFAVHVVKVVYLFTTNADQIGNTYLSFSAFEKIIMIFFGILFCAFCLSIRFGLGLVVSKIKQIVTLVKTNSAKKITSWLKVKAPVLVLITLVSIGLGKLFAHWIINVFVNFTLASFRESIPSGDVNLFTQVIRGDTGLANFFCGFITWALLISIFRGAERLFNKAN